MASVCSERMRQISSANFEVCGSNSLNHMPLWPCCAKLNTDGAMGKRFCPAVMPVSRCSPRTELGKSLSNCDASPGL